ncbi:hypothetical protein [Spirochaeta thermophila]|nr:hypothetical protein [Spirochaeta thermophila]
MYKGTRWDDTCVTGIFLERVSPFDPEEYDDWEPAKEVEEWEKRKKK